MRLLLDTHIFLWLLTGDSKLTAAIRDAITDLNNVVFLSPLSLMEAIIKYHSGKLALPQPPDPYLRVGRELHNVLSLPVDEVSVVQVGQLPLLHPDPFDCLLIGQVIHHNLQLVTVDAAMRAYPTAPILTF